MVANTVLDLTHSTKCHNTRVWYHYFPTCFFSEGMTFLHLLGAGMSSQPAESDIFDVTAVLCFYNPPPTTCVT